jgi:glutathione S-transferase
MVLYEKQLPFMSCLLDLQKFEHLTPAYIAIVSFVDRIDVLLPELLARAPYSRTKDWFVRMQNRAAFPSALRFTEAPRAASLPSI